jgi:hypothetical protein
MAATTPGVNHASIGDQSDECEYYGPRSNIVRENQPAIVVGSAPSCWK